MAVACGTDAGPAGPEYAMTWTHTVEGSDTVLEILPTLYGPDDRHEVLAHFTGLGWRLLGEFADRRLLFFIRDRQ